MSRNVQIREYIRCHHFKSLYNYLQNFLFHNFAISIMLKIHILYAKPLRFLILLFLLSPLFFTVENFSQTIPRSSCDFVWSPQLTMLVLKIALKTRLHLQVHTKEEHTHTHAHMQTDSGFVLFSLYLLTLSLSLL